MQNTGDIMRMLLDLAQALQPGVAQVREYVLWFLFYFGFYELVRRVYVFTFHGGELVGPIASTLIKISLLQWAIGHWGELAGWCQETMVSLGLMIGMNSINIPTFMDPGAYVVTGLRVGELLYATLTANLGLTTIGLGIVYFILYLIYQASFLVLAGNIFVWQAEFCLITAVAVVLLPTLATRSLSWIGQGVLSYLANASVKFGLAAVLASITFPLLQRLTITQPPTIQSVIVTCGTSWTLCFLFWRVNRLSSVLLSGQPSLTFSDLVSSAVNTAMAGAGIAAGGVAVGAGGAAMLASGARAGVMTGAGIRAGVSSLAGGSGPSAAFGAARAAASSAGASPSMARLSSFAGSAGARATSSARTAGRFAYDFSRYVGGDHSGIGARR